MEKKVICHAELSGDPQGLSISSLVIKQRDPEQKHLRMTQGWRVGFTLIELLVVVLIIGILSAIAIPQYQKAVWKSRATQSLVLVKNLANAQEAYFLENGTYATKFNELVFDFDVLPDKTQGTAAVSSNDAFRNNDMLQLVVNVFSNVFVLSSAQFKTGPYASCGFIFHHQSNDMKLNPKTLYCVEPSTGLKQGDFCQKIIGAKNLIDVIWGVRFFELP